ncbi:MAG: ATPase/DNA packaging protein [Myxococcaceae bacterium]
MKRVVVYDPCDEWSEAGRATSQVDLGPCKERVTFDEFTGNVLRYLDRERYSLAIVPGTDDADEQAEQVATLCAFMMHVGNVLVVLEEVGAYSFDNTHPAKAQKAINVVANRGRHEELPMVMVCQRMVHMSKSTRAQLTALETFAQLDDDDVDAIAARTRNAAWVEEVPNLKRGQSRVWVSPLVS